MSTCYFVCISNKWSCVVPSGAASFAVAHVMYICAFGLKPLRPSLYVKMLPLMAVVYWYIYNGLTDTGLKVAVLCYIMIILFMNWRALAKIK